MQTAPLHAKIFLRGVVASFRSSGIEEASVEDVIEHCFAICHVDGHKKPAYNEFLRSANWLETSSFILTDNLSHGIHAKGIVQYKTVRGHRNSRLKFLAIASRVKTMILNLSSTTQHISRGYIICLEQRMTLPHIHPRNSINKSTDKLFRYLFTHACHVQHLLGSNEKYQQSHIIWPIFIIVVCVNL